MVRKIHVGVAWPYANGYQHLGHLAGAYAVVFSPDDTRVASSSYDKTIRIWDVASGEEAVERLSEERFDLVLLDLKMPGMDGMEVLKRIRAMDEAILVIVITGFAPRLGRNTVRWSIGNGSAGGLRLGGCPVSLLLLLLQLLPAAASAGGAGTLRSNRVKAGIPSRMANQPSSHERPSASWIVSTGSSMSSRMSLSRSHRGRSETRCRQPPLPPAWTGCGRGASVRGRTTRIRLWSVSDRLTSRRPSIPTGWPPCRTGR